MKKNTTSFLHSGNIGDVWAALPAINECYKKTGKKAVLHLMNGMRADYYEGAVHPTKNENGEHVQLNLEMISMMKPLLLHQPCIEDAIVHSEGDVIQVDLNAIRNTYVGMPNFSINRWYFYVYPDLACDLTQKWLTVPECEYDLSKNKILINRTERYTNRNIDYSFLKDYEDDCLFIGTIREYNNFCMSFGLEIKKLHVENFLEYAQAVSQCKFYISNQSQGFQLAEGLRHPRILELCSFAPNVIISGDNAFDFFAQEALEYYFHRLNGMEQLFIDKHKKAPLI